jgi:SAM-dependent methyltransferase
MESNSSKQAFFDTLKNSLFEQRWIKLSLGNYKGVDSQLKQVFVKPVAVKQEPVLAFTLRYQTKDIHRNFDYTAGLSQVFEMLASDFQIATLFTPTHEYIFEVLKNGTSRLREKAVISSASNTLTHDRVKNRMVPQTALFLQKLGLSSIQGEIFKQAQDKYRQIDKYIEIVSSLIADLPDKRCGKVLDMGSGKGYLTFALYDYLQRTQGSAEVIGVEYRQDMVDLCNRYAQELTFENLHFEKGTIDSYQTDNIDLLIALHACDTATDDAIAKGIKANARLIVVAPCCHKQVRREIEKHKVHNELDFITKHGIFLERQAEMVTDGLRTLVMEYFGYKTKAFQFVSDVHTPKNVMVVGIKSKTKTAKEQKVILAKIAEVKAFFGIRYQQLEQQLIGD